MPFIQVTDNIIVNTDHVVSLVYEPAKPKRIDEPSKLTIQLSSLTRQTVQNYGSDPVQAIATSEEFDIHGEKADDVWSEFQSIAIRPLLLNPRRRPEMPRDIQDVLSAAYEALSGILDGYGRHILNEQADDLRRTQAGIRRVLSLESKEEK